MQAEAARRSLHKSLHVLDAVQVKFASGTANLLGPLQHNKRALRWLTLEQRPVQAKSGSLTQNGIQHRVSQRLLKEKFSQLRQKLGRLRPVFRSLRRLVLGLVGLPVNRFQLEGRLVISRQVNGAR